MIMRYLYIFFFVATRKIDCANQDNKSLYKMNMFINCANSNTTEEYVRDVISDKLKWGEIEKIVMNDCINGNGYNYKTISICMKTWNSEPDAENIRSIIESSGKIVVQLSENKMDCWVITQKND